MPDISMCASSKRQRAHNQKAAPHMPTAVDRGNGNGRPRARTPANAKAPLKAALPKKSTHSDANSTLTYSSRTRPSTCCLHPPHRPESQSPTVERTWKSSELCGLGHKVDATNALPKRSRNRVLRCRSHHEAPGSELKRPCCAWSKQPSKQICASSCQ